MRGPMRWPALVPAVVFTAALGEDFGDSASNEADAVQSSAGHADGGGLRRH